MLAVLVALLGVSGALAASADFSYFTPKFYDVLLNVGTSPAVNSPVTGSANLCFLTKTSTSKIPINWGPKLNPTSPTVSDLKITKQSDLSATPTTITVQSVALDTTQNILLITCSTTDGSNAFSENEYVNITVSSFSTVISLELFRHDYVNSDNTSSWVLFTNLGRLGARNLFPCWDDPHYTAGMKLVIKRPSLCQSGASIPRTCQQEDASTKLTTDCFYTTTPFAASSLVFFVVNDMTKTDFSAAQASGTTLHFWTPKDTNPSTLTGNIPYLAGHYYRIESQLPAAAPPDIHILLVTNLAKPIVGRGVILIRNDSYSGPYSAAQTEGLFTANVLPVLRAFVFNFLPSCDTLPDCWFQTAATDFLIQRFLTTGVISRDDQSWTSELAAGLSQEALLTSLALDCGGSSGPLVSPTIADLTVAGAEAALADPIRIYKGGVLLNMLNQVYGAGSVIIFDVIKTIINKRTPVSTSSFLESFVSAVQASGSYSPPDEATALQHLSLWFETSCCPLVNVSDVVTGDPGSLQLMITSFPGGRALPTSGLNVPVTLSSRTEPRDSLVRQNIWVSSIASTPTTASLTIHDGDWVVANPRSTWYYRTASPEDNGKKIQEALARGSGEIPNCPQVVDDAFALSKVGKESFERVLGLLISALRNAQYNCMQSVNMALKEVRDYIWKLPNQYSAYKGFVTNFMMTVVTQLNNGTYNERDKARITKLFHQEFCELDIRDYRKKALDHLTPLLGGKLPTTLPSSVYEGAMCCAAKFSTSLSPQTLWLTLSDRASTYYMKHFAAVALGCHPSYSEVSSLFNTMLAEPDSGLAPHINTVLQLVAQQHPTELFNNITFFSTKIQSMIGASGLVSLIRSAAAKVNTNEQATAISGLTSSTTVDDVVKTAASGAVAAVAARVEWLQTYNTSLVKALRAYTPSSGALTTTPGLLLTLSLPVLLAALRT